MLKIQIRVLDGWGAGLHWTKTLLNAPAIKSAQDWKDLLEKVFAMPEIWLL
jgi:hypothetical protein